MVVGVSGIAQWHTLPWKRTSFLLYELNPLLNDLAQFTVDFSFIKTVAARTDHTGTLSNEHSVFIGPFNNFNILLGVRWLDTALVFSGEALCSSKQPQKCYEISLWECKESRSATIPKLRRAGALPKGGRAGQWSGTMLFSGTGQRIRPGSLWKLLNAKIGKALYAWLRQHFINRLETE